jgi:hypothetical protein
MTLFIKSAKTTALVTDTAVPFNHKFSSTEAEKITRYEQLATDLKISGSLTMSLYTPYKALGKVCSTEIS